MSSNTGDYPDGPARKRLRKGTRSCQECRRRKVRCVWPQHSQRCDECNSRRIQCIEQDVYIPRFDSTKPTDSKSIHQRLDDLETTLSHLMKNDSLANKSVGTTEEAVIGNITNLREDIYPRSSRSPILSQARSEDLSRSTSGDIEESLHEAPVLSLFRGHVSAQQTTDPFTTSHEKEAKEVQELRTLLLSVDNFSRILAFGQYTRDIWHRTFPESVKAEYISSQDPSSPNEDIREHYANSLESSNLGLLTRVGLCLAIHLQQLPRSFDFSKISPSSSSSQSLQDHYLAKAEIILALDSELGNSVDSIECMLLAYEFHINRGNPRKAWLTIRRAIDTAYLLNLHHKQENSRLKSLWSQLSFYDRNIALVLGLPNSIPDAHLKGKLGNEFLEKLELIMGRVVDRNINHASMTLDNTLKIDHEMEDCRQLKSDNWWSTSPSFDLPMSGNSVYQMFVAKVLFHNTRKLLHLPYMLKSYTDIKYRMSRTIALESSRAMIRVFAVLHGDSNPALHLCEMADFQIFTAALLILIDILMDPLCRNESKHREDDWELVHTTIKIMKHISETMLCNLATQAVQLLNNLRGVDLFAPSPLEFEILIPYFGKFLFRKGDTSSIQAETVAAVDKTLNDLSTSNMTDVDFPLLPEVGFDLSQNCFQPWEELDFDWSSISDPRLYDSWNWSMNGLKS